MNKRRLAVACILIVTVAAACYAPTPTSAPLPAPAAARSLLETRWAVSQLNGAQLSIPDLRPTLIFGGKDTIIGNGGCTGFRGPFFSSGNSITLGPLSAGTASCGQAADQQEQAYLEALQAATSYSLDGNELVLLDASGKELVRLSRTE